MASAVGLRIRFSVQMKRSFWGWFIASLLLGCRRGYVLLNCHAFKPLDHLLLKPSE
jgi:hypothetical protein